MKPLDIPVLIVGGGGSGLSASCFLADLGVDSLLVERHPGTSHLPKAHYLNQRTMEVFRQHRLADAVFARAAPRESLGKKLWRTPLGGGGPLDGRVFKAVDVMGGGALSAVYDLHGTTPPTNIAQLYLEPVLRAEAERRNPQRVLFHHELLSFDATPGGIAAQLRNRDTGEVFPVRAQYLLGADAGKTVGPAIGVNMKGPERVMTRVTVHFAADLSGFIHEDSAVMHCIVNPNGAKAGDQLFAYLIAFGPERWGRHSEEWGITLAFPLDEEVNLDKDHIAGCIKAFLQIDCPITVLNVSQWFQETMIADKFGEGRILLIGDAAHKHPPASGLGLNSGIQDAHNVCWKLAMVLKGQAGPDLLRTYEPERRPVVERNAQHSMLIMSNFALQVAALGVVEGAPPAFNQARMAALLADTADGAARRQRMDKVFELSVWESGCQDMDLGFTYASGAVVDDASPPVPRDPAGVRYLPSTRPGSRLPHVWLEVDGARRSTHDLIPLGGFALLTGGEGHGWCAAAQRIAAETGLPLHAWRIGAEADPGGGWARLCGIAPGGALLVRPDGHVGFRQIDADSDPERRLRAALGAVLARPDVFGDG